MVRKGMSPSLHFLKNSFYRMSPSLHFLKNSFYLWLCWVSSCGEQGLFSSCRARPSCCGGSSLAAELALRVTGTPLQLWSSPFVSRGLLFSCGARPSRRRGCSGCGARPSRRGGCSGCGARPSRRGGSSGCGARALGPGAQWFPTQAKLPHSLWGLPGSGIELVSPALAGGFSTTGPPGKPTLCLSWLLSLAHQKENHHVSHLEETDSKLSSALCFARQQ